MMHNLRCTEQNPLPLNLNKMEISEELEKKEEVNQGEKKFTNDNNNIQGEKIFTNDGDNIQEENKFTNDNNYINDLNDFNNFNDLIEEPPKEDFPEVVKCDICNEMFYENELNDHKLCHILENEEKNRVNNSDNNIRISRIDIDEQKKIEKQIEKDNRRKMANQIRNNQNNFSNNYNNNDIFYDDLFPNPNNLNNYSNNNNNNNFIPNLNSLNNNNNNNNQNIRPNTQNRRRHYNNNNNNNINHRIHIHQSNGNHNNNNMNQRIKITIRQQGPNGEIVTHHYSNNERQNVQNVNRNRRPNHNNNNNVNNNINNNNNNSRHNNNLIVPSRPVFVTRRRIIPFIDINNRNTIGTIFRQVYSDLESGVHGTDRQILNELPETKIEDVSKLDADKKNCVICLEDFKNKDKAIILPCIHLFHNNCIKNWLKKQNSCPICKFKLTGENMQRQINNFV